MKTVSRCRTAGYRGSAPGISSGGVDWPTEDCRANLVILVAVDRSRVAAYLSILQKIIKWRKSLGGSAAGISPEEMARGLELALN